MHDEAVDQTLAFLHANLRGNIRFDGDRVPIKVIVAPDGHIVAPVMESMLRSVEVVLELPDDGDEGLQVMVTMERLDPEGEHAGLCDRWCAYHGDPEDVRWARMQIDASRHLQWFVDGEALMRANPLAKDEASLLKALNTQPRSFLKAFCTTCKVDCKEPVAVGLDPGGIDIRRAHDTARLPFPLRFERAEQVRSFIEGNSAPFTPGMA
ncbi:MAG: hypothetical protein FJ292_00190 [Planctomycetes bacterium]|nr:hypothetical protein [Planctomycetota bacterium]